MKLLSDDFDAIWSLLTKLQLQGTSDCASYKIDATSEWFPINDNRGSVNDEADETIEASLNEVDDDCSGLCEFALLGGPCIPHSLIKE